LSRRVTSTGFKPVTF